MSDGWVIDEDTGVWYFYVDDEVITGWKDINGSTYYFNKPGGSMAFSKEVDAKYLGPDGRQVKSEKWVNTEEDKSGTWYYVGADEEVFRGWNKVGSKFYYFNKPGGSMTWDNNIDGFYLNNDGELTDGTGWLKDNNTGKWYYYSDGEMKTGWLQYGNSWYYMDSDGKMVTGWQCVKDFWYYLQSDGSMASKKWVNDGTGWYYLYIDGSMARGTTANGYYVDQENGKMVTGAGWQNKDNKYFYLNSDDSVVTGWLKDKNNWYYFYPENSDSHYQGEMAEDTIINGWKVDSSGKWITNDDANIGWKQIGDDWYYFNDSGKIVTNTWIQGSDGNSWYYVDSDGKMKTTDYKEYDNGRRIYFHQDGTAFEFDYDGGDGEYTDDIDNAISLIPGGKAGVIVKNLGKTIVKGAEKKVAQEIEKKAAQEIEKKAAQEIEKKTAEKVIEGGTKTISDAIKEIPENTKHHILNGTKSARKDTTAGHSWEALFDGEKPDFDKVESLLEKAYKDGKCTSQKYNIGKGKTMIKDKYTIDIDGKEVWLETVEVNGKLTIGDGGVNIK